MPSVNVKVDFKNFTSLKTIKEDESLISQQNDTFSLNREKSRKSFGNKQGSLVSKGSLHLQKENS